MLFNYVDLNFCIESTSTGTVDVEQAYSIEDTLTLSSGDVALVFIDGLIGIGVEFSRLQFYK